MEERLLRAPKFVRKEKFRTDSHPNTGRRRLAENHDGIRLDVFGVEKKKIPIK